MPEWKRVRIDFKTVKLGNFIESVKTTVSEINDNRYYEVYGVTNIDGIVKTGKKASADISKYLIIDKNYFAYNPYRINVGSIGVNFNSVKGCVSPAYVVFKTKENLDSTFLWYYLKSEFGNHLINWYGNRGGVRNALRYDDLCQIDIPDIEYQKQLNVIEKVDRFDKYRRNLENELDHQQSLLKQLRQAILQEAVEGKLTAEWREKHLTKRTKTTKENLGELCVLCENDPNYSARALLEKITAEKRELTKTTKRTKKEQELPPINDDEKPFELPDGWVWCRLGEIIQFSENLNIQAKLNPNQIIHYVDIDAIDNIKFVIREPKILPVSKLSSRARRILKPGYILYSLVRPYLNNITIVKEGYEYFIGSTGFSVFKAIMIQNEFLFYFLLSTYIRKHYLELLSGFNSPNITHDQFANTITPLPPLAEQQAIVEKVDRLLANIAALEQQVSERKAQAEQLMQAVLREAFAGD